MSKVVLLLLFSGDNIVVSTRSGSVQIMQELLPTSDSKPAIQLALDWCEQNEGRETIKLPPGVWKIASSVELVSNVEVVADGVTLEPYDATFQKSLIVAGSSTHSGGGGTRPQCDDVALIGITLNQSACTSYSSHCMFVANGNNWRLERVKAKNSKHEGIVSGAYNRNWFWDRVEAEDCGAGSVFRGQSGAGINCNGIQHTLVDCVTRRCGQGYEHGGIKTSFIRCKALDGLQPGASFQGPAVGFNLGNAVIGLYRTRLADCESTGHSTAINVGNPIGRVGGLSVDSFTATDGAISFSGGKPNNTVTTPDEGPDLEPSSFTKCKVTINSALGGMCYLANSGLTPAEADIHGRASVAFVDCEAVIPDGEPDWMASAPFLVRGKWTGNVTFESPVIRGPRGASKAQGDFAQASIGSNAVPISQPNVRALKGSAFKQDGTERAFRVMRESRDW